MPPRKPPLRLQATTLWEYPSQHYGTGVQGNPEYKGATPSWIIWNLLERYTREGDLVVDPMCGGGTTIDVCHDLDRRVIGYDLEPSRDDILPADARELPLQDNAADFVFVDPPYSTHIEYSDDPRCIGKLEAQDPAYYEAIEGMVAEVFRIMRDRRYMALYCSDSHQQKKPFCPIGFELFGILACYFKPVDIICVVRHNSKLKRRHWHEAAIDGNYFLRGFNYLLIMKKELDTVAPRRGRK